MSQSTLALWWTATELIEAAPTLSKAECAQQHDDCNTISAIKLSGCNISTVSAVDTENMLNGISNIVSPGWSGYVCKNVCLTWCRYMSDTSGTSTISCAQSSSNQPECVAVRGGSQMQLIGHPGMKAQVKVASNARHLDSTALQKDANATLVVSKQKIVFFPRGCVKRAVKYKSVAHGRGHALKRF